MGEPTAFDILCAQEPWRKPRQKEPHPRPIKAIDEPLAIETRWRLLKARINALRPFLPNPQYSASSGLVIFGQDAEHITMIPLTRRGLPYVPRVKPVELSTTFSSKSVYNLL